MCHGPTKLFRHMEAYLRYEDRYTRRAYFIFFTLQSTKITKLSRKDFIQCYFNFRVLRVSNRNNNINTSTCKRKALTDITNNITSPSENRGKNNENDLHIITPPIVPERIFTTDPVVDYFLSKDAKTLFNCPENETVYEYLSRRIDCFDDILSRKSDISKIVHKAEQKGCEMGPCQNILMIQKMQYLQ